MIDQVSMENMELQLRSLYEERERLDHTIGTSTADGIVEMVRNLESQLCALYEQHGHKVGDDQPDFQGLLHQVRELGSELDREYARRSITLTVENNKPVLRASWETATTAEGDHR